MELDASTPHEQYERLFLELTARIDTGHASDGVELFTPDAVLEVGGRSYCGHDEIAGFLALREARSDPSAIVGRASASILSAAGS
jgi:hypothetical protein